MSKRSSNDKKFPDRYGPHLVLALLSVCSLIIYWRILNAPFVFDDLLHIGKNENIGNLSYYLWPPTRTRYITELTFALNYYFFGMNLLAFHIVNVIAHILASFALFLLARETFSTPAMRGYSEGHGRGDMPFYIAAGSALIFAAHPVQTGAVSYIVQRATVFAALFYMLSVYLYARWRNSAVKEEKLKFGPLYFIVLALTFLAQLTKENCVTLPLMIILYDLAFFDDRKGLRARAYLIPYVSVFVVIPLLVVYLSVVRGSGVLTTLNAMVSAEVSPYIYLINQFRVMLTYLRLIVIPIGQTVDYDYQVSTSIFDGRITGSLALLIVFAAIAVYVYIKAKRGKDRLLKLAVLGAAWFAITISVESSIIPIRDFIFEHRVYLPLAGATVLFLSVLARVLEKISVDYARQIMIAVIVAVCIVFGAVAYARNAVWASPLAFWTDAAEKAPDKARVHDNLGSVYKMEGYLNDAIRQYEIAVMLEPRLLTARKNLGSTYYIKERYAQAAIQFEKIIELAPGRADAHTNLADAYHGLGMKKEAIEHYRKSLELNPAGTVNYYNLGVVYEELGEIDKAIENYQAFVDRAPDKYRMEKYTVTNILVGLKARRSSGQRAPSRSKSAGR